MLIVNARSSMALTTTTKTPIPALSWRVPIPRLSVTRVTLRPATEKGSARTMPPVTRFIASATMATRDKTAPCRLCATHPLENRVWALLVLVKRTTIKKCAPAMSTTFGTLIAPAPKKDVWPLWEEWVPTVTASAPSPDPFIQTLL